MQYYRISCNNSNSNNSITQCFHKIIISLPLNNSIKFQHRHFGPNSNAILVKKHSLYVATLGMDH